MADIGVASFTPASGPIGQTAAPLEPPPPTPRSAFFNPTPQETALLNEIKQRESSGGNYTAVNPDSSASGAYQFLDKTWHDTTNLTGVPKYARAKDAPRWVQDVNALALLRNGGGDPDKAGWAASGPYDVAAITGGAQPQQPVGPQTYGQGRITPEMYSRAANETPQALLPSPTPARQPAPVTVASFEPAPSAPVQPPAAPLGQQAVQSFVNFGRDIGAAAYGASAAVNRQLANAADMVSRITGLPAGGLFRDWQQAQEKTAAQLAGGRTDLAGQITRGVTQGILQLPEYAVAATVAGPVAGMAAIGGITEADKGWLPALKAAAEGGLTGGALAVMGPASRMLRLTGAAAMAYAQARLNGADNTTALAHATTMGGMAAIPGGGVTLSELHPEAAEAVSRAGQALGDIASRTAQAAKGGVVGAAKAAIEPVQLKKFGIGITVPKPLVTGLGTAEVAGMVGLPKPLGFAVGAAAPVAGGFMRGVREGFRGPEAESATLTPEAPAPAPPQTPGQAYAASAGIDWEKLSPTDRQTLEHVAQARANAAGQPPPVQTPIPPAAAGAVPLSETPAAPQPAPAVAPEAAVLAPETSPASAEVPAVPETPKPAPAEIAARLEESMRVDRLTDAVIRNQIPQTMLDDFEPKEWKMLADHAGVQPPTAEQIAEIKSNAAAYEQAGKGIEVTAETTPAEALEAFDRANRYVFTTKEGQPVFETPEAQAAAERLAREMPEHAVPPPEPGEPAPTAPEKRIEAMAQYLAPQDVPTGELAAHVQTTEGKLWLEKLAESLKLEGRPGSGEPDKMIARIRQLRGEGTIAPDVTQTQGGGGSAVPGTAGAVPAPATAVSRPGPGERGVLAGTATTLRIPGESATYPARYTVRELADIQASHNPHTFERNPEYTLKNDRNYSDPANQERIVLDSQPGRFVPEYLITDSPDAVNGPPVIDDIGNVLGGNSRAMKLGRVYANNPQDAARYRDLLEQRAANFGLDPAQIRSMRNPILVRELTGSTESPQRLVTDLNKSGTAALTAAERATADARRVSGDAADYLAQAIEAEGPDATLSDLLSGKRGAAVVNKLVDDGVFTMQEKPALVDARTGAVTAAAKERISKMLLGQVFEDADQMMRTAPEIRNKLERAVSPILQSGVKAGFDIRPTVRSALNLIEYARAHGITNLQDAIAQESMFGPGPEFSPEAVQLAQFLRDNKPTAISQAFRRYVANAEPTMFGESTPAEAFADAFGK